MSNRRAVFVPEPGGGDERGRELKDHELVVNTQYVIKADDRFNMTVWCVEIHSDRVVFWAGTVRMRLRLHRGLAGSLADDSGTRIRVYEWRKPPAFLPN